MIGILFAKFRMFIRNPWTFVIMTAMSIGFAFILGGNNQENSIQVPIYAEDEAIHESLVGEVIEESEIFVFKWMTKEELTEQISNGKAEVGVILLKDDFQILVGVDSPNVKMLKQIIQDAYVSRDQHEQIQPNMRIQFGKRKSKC